MASQNEIAADNTMLDGLEPSRLRSTPPTRCGLVATLGRVIGTLGLAVLLALVPQTVSAAERLAICYDKSLAQLVILAKLRDFYAAEGLDVEVRAFPSGRQALEAMLAGECALATAAETPTAHHSLHRNDFFILASISQSDNNERIIVRSDRGIHTTADLRGRSIAVPKFTIGHYFIDMYLVAHGLAPQDVKQVFMLPQEIAPAFRRGEVEAAAHWEPYIQNIQILSKEFGAKTKVFTAPGLHVSPFLLVGGRDYVRKNSAAIERVLRALMRAERYAKEQPANAKALIAHFSNTEQPEIDLIWSLQDLRVSLDQSLLFILENAARWEIGLMPPAQRPALPNYLDFIYLDGLKTVKPDAVTIIH